MVQDWLMYKTVIWSINHHSRLPALGRDHGKQSEERLAKVVKVEPVSQPMPLIQLHRKKVIFMHLKIIYCDACYTLYTVPLGKTGLQWGK